MAKAARARMSQATSSKTSLKSSAWYISPSIREKYNLYLYTIS